MREILIFLIVLAVGAVAILLSQMTSNLVEPVTIIMVRHAERGDGDNPELTLAGRQRAEVLADLMRNVDLAAIYSTPFNRTEQTARPTADKNEIAIEHYMFSALAEIEPFMSQLASQYAGKTVLMIGHSDLIPIIHAVLRGEEVDFNTIEFIGENDFDNIYTVIYSDIGDVKILEEQYGEPTPDE